jgi:hypothetical protein
MLCFVGTAGSFDAHKTAAFGHDASNGHTPTVIDVAAPFYTSTSHKWPCACHLIIHCYTQAQGLDDVVVVNQ